MRGRFQDQGGLFSYLSPEARVPPRHPLRQIREFVRTVLKELSVSFGKLYSNVSSAGANNMAQCARPAGGFLLNLIAYNLIRIPKLVAT